MKFEFFIASKNLKSEETGKKVARPIIRISIISICLAVSVNLVTFAVVIGFQHQVQDKVLGFGSHAHVSSATSTSLAENEPILKQQGFLELIQNKPFVKNIQPVAYKPAIFQTDKNKAKTQDIQSVLVKGVDHSYNFDFFKQNLVKGKIPHFALGKRSNEMLISAKIATNLQLKVGDSIRTFFVKNQPIRRYFVIAGIFDTGMDEFDKRIVITDIRHIQELNDWGMQVSIDFLDTLANGYHIIKATAQGGNGNYRFDWGKGYNTFAGFSWNPTKDSVFQVVASDYWMFIDGKGEETAIPDTAHLKVHLASTLGSRFQLNADGTLKKIPLKNSEYDYKIAMNDQSLFVRSLPGKGSFNNYVGGFEINFKNWDAYDAYVADLKKEVNFTFSSKKQDIRVTSLKENQEEIFVWLSFLDINVWIIISLMLLIGIINMGSTMLVMILVKSPMIGLFKAFGASNWTIRKVFLIQVSYLIAKGMLWGNIIGIGLCLIQQYTQLISLNPEVYYLDAVPVELSIWTIVFVNLLTFVVCLLSMMIPSYFVARIQPVKAIKFN